MKKSDDEAKGTRELVYVNDFDHGICRRRCGRGFTYVSEQGKTITSARSRKRIKGLAIPPAWTDVRICSDPRGHIQAVGRDAAHRRQYIYHPDWDYIRSETKYDRMQLMAEKLPRIRSRVCRDLDGKQLNRERVIAAVIRLIDKTRIRVGSVEYARTNGSHGATTLTASHVECNGFTVALRFPGKSGQRYETEFNDQRLAKVVHRCEEIDGQFLFCYRDEDGTERPVDSTAVNEYLREAAGDPVTAKDFRTWWGTVFALKALSGRATCELSAHERRKAVSEAVTEVAELLGNTPAICRESYIHPGLLQAFADGMLSGLLKRAQRRATRRSGLTADESRLVALLPLLGGHRT